MTGREFELWLEGWRDRQDQVLQNLAWVQTNLINYANGVKQPMKIEKLLPKKGRKTKSDEELLLDVMAQTGTSSKEIRQTRRDIVRARKEEEESKRFWESPEGRRLTEYLDTGD